MSSSVTTTSVDVAQAPFPRQLGLDVLAGDRRQAVVGHAHREQTGHLARVRLGGDGGIEPAQAVEQLVGAGFHADLDGMVEPVALRLARGGLDGASQPGGVGQRRDVRGGIRHREQDVGGEEDLARRVADGVVRQPPDGDGATLAQLDDALVLVPTDAACLREEGSPDRLGHGISVSGSFECGDAPVPACGQHRVASERQLQLCRDALSAITVEGCLCGSLGGWLGQDGAGSCVVRVRVIAEAHQEGRRDLGHGVRSRFQPRSGMQDRQSGGGGVGVQHPTQQGRQARIDLGLLGKGRGAPPTCVGRPQHATDGACGGGAWPRPAGALRLVASMDLTAWRTSPTPWPLPT